MMVMAVTTAVVTAFRTSYLRPFLRSSSDEYPWLYKRPRLNSFSENATVARHGFPVIDTMIVPRQIPFAHSQTP